MKVLDTTVLFKVIVLPVEEDHEMISVSILQQQATNGHENFAKWIVMEMVLPIRERTI